jgi:hypothetical protein
MSGFTITTPLPTNSGAYDLVAAGNDLKWTAGTPFAIKKLSVDFASDAAQNTSAGRISVSREQTGSIKWSASADGAGQYTLVGVISVSTGEARRCTTRRVLQASRRPQALQRDRDPYRIARR